MRRITRIDRRMVYIAFMALLWAMCDTLPTPQFARSRSPAEEALLVPWHALIALTQRTVRQGHDPTVIKDLRNKKSIQQVVNTTFPCDTSTGRSPQPPTSVHQLRPGDIDIVSAIGDSLTAAHGAVSQHVFHVFMENRGMSWSIGGQDTWREFLTLPNILKEFNPNLFGYSLGDARGFQKATQFNVGEMAAMNQDLPWQAKILARRMRKDPRVDMKRHWKLVTILMGSNDFCSDMCYRNWRSLPEEHYEQLTVALRILKESIPRLFVNIVTQPNLRILHDMKGAPPMCEIFRTVACPCLYGQQFKANRAAFYDLMSRYQDVEWKVAENPEFQTDDFAVVIQPFTYRLTFPLRSPSSTDFSFMASDCFHFSQKGYARAANALWNNMLEPVGEKSPDWQNQFEKFLCPTPERPFLSTARNSKISNQVTL